MASNSKPIQKPLLRGHFHQAAFFYSLGACSMLIAKSLSATKNALMTITSILIYSISLCILFGISAFYHRVHWGPKLKMWMQGLDHAAIFILIAGTATPVCLLSLEYSLAEKILFMIWGAAGIGVLQSVFLVNAPKWLASVLYVIVGWLVVPYYSELRDSLGPMNIFFLLAGGISYTVGAVIYSIKYPNPYPKYFGYHEIFHIMVIFGALFHFLVIFHLVM